METQAPHYSGIASLTSVGRRSVMNRTNRGAKRAACSARCTIFSNRATPGIMACQPFPVYAALASLFLA